MDQSSGFYVPDWDELHSSKFKLPAVRSLQTTASLTGRAPSVGLASQRSGKTVTSAANKYDVMLTEMLNRAAAPSDPSEPDVRCLACHLALLSLLMSAGAFGPLTTIIRRIYSQVVLCSYTLDHSMELPATIVTADSELARIPYFKFAESLMAELVRLRETTAEAQLAAEGKEALQVQLATMRADQIRLVKELTTENSALEAQKRILQEKLDSCQMELTGLKTNFATKLEAQASELRDSEERVMLLEKQVTFLSNSEVNTAVTAKDNRLVQKAGLANTEAADDDAAEEVPLPEAVIRAGQALEMQQQLLELMDLQIKDFDAAMGVTEDDNDRAHLATFFNSEADSLSKEVRNIGTALEVLEEGEEGERVQTKLKLFLPHELGKSLEANGDVRGQQRDDGDSDEDGEPGPGGEKEVKINYQDPVWRNFLSLCTAGTVVQTQPRVLEASRVNRLVIDVLWRFIRRGPGHGSNVSAFLFKQLVGIYQHEHAALLVMQDLCFTITRGRKDSEVLAFFSSILSSHLDLSTWQYLLLQYARYRDELPPGSFGLRELKSVVASVFPFAGDDEIGNLLRIFRSSGLSGSAEHLLVFFIRLVKDDMDPRFARGRKLLKQKDVQVIGGLTQRVFVNVLRIMYSSMPSESVASMYEDALNGANMDFLPYEALVPVLAAIEMRTLVDAHNKKTKESNWGMTPLGEYPH